MLHPAEQLPFDSANVKFSNVTLYEGYVSDSVYQQTYSKITQTAEEIDLKVNEVSVKISDGIELNGNTKVNGSVTIKDDDTGFILTGSSGNTQISPKSIGSYSEFSNKSENNITSTNSSTAYSSTAISPNHQISFSWSFSTNLGTVPNGKVVTFRNANITFMLPNSGTTLSGSNITFKVLIKENDTLKYSNTVSTSTMNISNSITSTGGSFTVYYYVQASFSQSYWNTSGYVIQEVPFAKCNSAIQWSYATNNFQLIGYDGYAVNFGNNTTAYIGPNDTVFKYENYGIRLNINGLYRYVTDSISESLQKHLHGGIIYTDTVNSKYLQQWCPLNGYAIRQTTSNFGGNIYIDAKDDVIEVRNTSGTLNLFLGNPAYFIGKRIMIKKTSGGGDMDVYAGYSTSNSTYKIIRANTADRQNNYLDQQNTIRAYFSNGEYWIEEWLSW